MSEPKPTAPLAHATADSSAVVTELNRLFAKALLLVGKHGDADDLDTACRLAAQGWSLLRHGWQRDAERLNGVMHSLTGPRHSTQPREVLKTTDPKNVEPIEPSTNKE